MSTDGTEIAGGGAARAVPTGIAALLVSGVQDPRPLETDPFIDAGVQVIEAGSLDAAEGEFLRYAPALVFLPLTVDGRSARSLLDQIIAARPQPVVVVVASNDQINAAAEAMRAGAFDCLFRPFSTQRLARTLEAAIAALPAARRVAAPPIVPGPARDAPHAPGQAAGPSPAPDRIIAASAEMRMVLEHVDTVARSEAPVFITGEYGTGKDLIAHRLHERSARAGGPFVVLDCAVSSPARAEAELAGPTGALARAAGGTLYLDDICELDPKLQPQLLHLIDAVRRETSGQAPAPRIVSGTQHDAQAMIRAGQLRSDLYYRLHVAPIALPPLRARHGDIGVIARAKLEDFARSEDRGFAGIADDAMAVLETYEWPGNVRELINVIWSAVVLNDGPEVTAEMLPRDLFAPASAGADAAARGGLDDLVGLTLDEIERVVIEATIRAEDGSVPRAARVLDVSPSTLYRKREAWAKKQQG